MSNAYTAVAFRNSDPHHHSAGSTRALGKQVGQPSMWGGVAISLALIMEDHHGFRSRPAVVAARDSPSHHHPARTLLALIFTTPSKPKVEGLGSAVYDAQSGSARSAMASKRWIAASAFWALPMKPGGGRPFKDLFPSRHALRKGKE
jgi:hypothetical protein